MKREIFAADAGTDRVVMAMTMTAMIGTLKIAPSFFIRMKSPSGAFAMTGAKHMAKIARPVPKILPMNTTRRPSAFGLMMP